MKLGVILPTFADRVDGALETARRAEELGLHGVFCYDHLWPMGQPERPAIAPFPVLGRLAATTERLVLGTLVARVGLVPTATLVDQFATLDLVAPGRVVAGIGVGDDKSVAENRAYGLAFAPLEERLGELRRCALALRRRGLTVWAGGRGPHVRDLAAGIGVASNLWDVPDDEVRAQAARGEVTWAGPVPRAEADGGGARRAPLLAARVAALARAGASWAVFASPAPLPVLAELAGPAERGDLADAAP